MVTCFVTYIKAFLCLHSRKVCQHKILLIYMYTISATTLDVIYLFFVMKIICPLSNNTHAPNVKYFPCNQKLIPLFDNRQLLTGDGSPYHMLDF